MVNALNDCICFCKIFKALLPRTSVAGAREQRLNMQIETILSRRKEIIINQWIDLVISSYAPDTAQFIKSRKDRFANPIGSKITFGLTGLFEQLLADTNEEEVRKYLDPVVRIRAVQQFTASEAIAFVLALKSIVEKNLKFELRDSQTAGAYRAFSSKIDAMSLVAFDIYMECREKLYQLKTDTEKDKIYKAFERAGLIEQDP